MSRPHGWQVPSVENDGGGFALDTTPGVGLDSMLERTEEARAPRR